MIKRKWRLVGGAVLASLGVVGLVFWLLWPHTAITPENAAMIRKGMTLAEVESLFGGPARNESDMPDNFINDAFVLADPAEIKAGRLHPGPRPPDEKRWASPGYVVVVHFDDSGRVVRHGLFTFDVDRSLLDKVRRWLRL
jgi:hypothetical protein